MNAPIPETEIHDSKSCDELLQVLLMEQPLHGDKDVPALDLIAALRKYHHLRDLSHQERFGTPDRQSRQALSDLAEAQRSLQQLAFSKDELAQDFLVEATLKVKRISGPL